MPYLALFKQLKGPFNPSTLGNICSSFTKTSSITICPVTEALKANFPSIFGALSPSIPFSSMNPLIFPSSFFAQTIKTSAIGLLDIHIFAPEIE